MEHLLKSPSLHRQLIGPLMYLSIVAHGVRIGSQFQHVPTTVRMPTVLPIISYIKGALMIKQGSIPIFSSKLDIITYYDTN